MIHAAKAGKMARGPFYAGDPNRPADSMLSTRDLGEHRWRRRGWERGFGNLQLRQFEPRVIRHLDVLGSQFTNLIKNAGGVVNMTAWSEFFAYDVMSDLAFSEDFGMLKAGKADRYVTSLHGATRLLTIAAQTPWIRPVISYLPVVDKKSKEAGKEFGRISRETYDRRAARKVTEHDMFEYLSAPGDGPRPLTESELIADAGRKITPH